MNEITITLTEEQADIICRALSLLQEHDEKGIRETTRASETETDNCLKNLFNICAARYKNRTINCIRLQDRIESCVCEKLIQNM